MRKWFWLFLVLSALNVAAIGQTITDDFNGSSLNPALWSAVPGGGTVTQTGGRLVVTINPGAGHAAAGVILNSIISGDFDAQVDYTILTWPTSPPPTLGIQINFDPMDAAYEIARAYNSYLANYQTCCVTVPTSDTSGKLRLTRTGAIFSAYYYAGSAGWQLLRASAEGNLTKASVIYLGIYGTGLAAASAAFDNFSITTPLCPFFNGQVNGGGGTQYLQLLSGATFGYFGYLGSNWIYHVDLGYEWVAPGNDAASSIYTWDLTSGHWFYTNPAVFPYLYDFTWNAWLYYFPDTHKAGHYTTNPRYFANMNTSQIFTM